MDIILQKQALRKRMRKERLAHAQALPPQVSALIFNRPPAPVLEWVPDDAIIGLYRASAGEAPTAGYARFFHERGNRLALPFISGADEPMRFLAHTDPHDESDLDDGPFGLRQPAADAEKLSPDILFVPVVAFTADGRRLGQGGGFYDQFIAQHPALTTIGMAWDIQLVEDLPTEPHDRNMTAVVTPTRIYGPLA